ncbi:MAG: response regulator [Deltaproteobacteria bacterium]
MKSKEETASYEKHTWSTSLRIMPGMGGAATYELFKAMDTHIKVLLSSGYSIDGEATRILNQGCNGFIKKPFNFNELSTKIQDVLDHSSGHLRPI